MTWLIPLTWVFVLPRSQGRRKVFDGGEEAEIKMSATMVDQGQKIKIKKWLKHPKVTHKNETWTKI